MTMLPSIPSELIDKLDALVNELNDIQDVTYDIVEEYNQRIRDILESYGYTALHIEMVFSEYPQTDIYSTVDWMDRTFYYGDEHFGMFDVDSVIGGATYFLPN